MILQRLIRPAEGSIRPALLSFTLSLGFGGFIFHETAGGQGEFFLETAESSGLKFDHMTGATGEFHLPEIMGPGVALFDYDLDGDLDIYLPQGAPLNSENAAGQSGQPDQAARLSPKLYRNELIGSGNSARSLYFTDVSAGSGLTRTSYGMGAAVGDYDDDGDPDLYVTGFGPNFLYRNNQDGTFTDVTMDSGTQEPRWSTSAAFVDYDRDGDLDLFVLNYVDFTVAGNRKCYNPLGTRDYCNPQVYRPVPDRLFRNEGKGKFVDVSEKSGINQAVGPGLGVTCADFNDDGWTDIYVANDGTANYLWINNGNGTFNEGALFAGAAYNAEGIAEASMGVAAGDFDNDGDEDLFMTHLTMETNTLYVNDGSGKFHDQTIQAGLAKPSYPFTGFGAEWIDYDNDGHLDLFIANGAVRNTEPNRGKAYPYDQRNQLFHNLGNGTFRERSAIAGPAFRLSEVSRGAAFGDIDDDGDIDVVMTNNNGSVRLFLNQAGSVNHWLGIRLAGALAEGARVGVVRSNGKILWRRSRRDGSYLSANDARVHFGLGQDAAILGVLVQWPSGRREMWRDIQADTIVTLHFGEGQSWPDHLRRATGSALPVTQNSSSR